MTDLRKAAEMALEALSKVMLTSDKGVACENAAKALRQALAQPDLAKVGEVGVWGNSQALAESANSTTSVVESKALAQPEQEPECVAIIGNWGKVQWREDVFPQLGAKLYSAPPKREWVGLTDEERHDVLEDATGDGGRVYYDTLFRSYEAKLKEKNA